ncbi:MAG: hypothetical protein AAFY28_13710, partial [Actinomycetota bacterium]
MTGDRSRFRRSRGRAIGSVGVVGALFGTLLVALPTEHPLHEPPVAEALNTTNIVFDRPGTPPVFGPNELVEIFAGNINYIGGQTSIPGVVPGLPNRLVGACEANTAGTGLRAHKGVDDTIQPFADLYLVPAGSSFSDNQALTDASGAPNSVFGGLGGSYIFQGLGITLPSGNIGSGVYGIVVDECQNGHWDAGEDSFVDNAFRVDLDQDVPPLSPNAQRFRELKEAARRMAPALRTVENLNRLREIHGHATRAAGAVAAAASPEALAVFVINQAVGALQANSPYNVARKRAEAAIKSTIAQHRRRQQLLANDPPQPDFKRAAAPVTAGAYFEESTGEFHERYAAWMAARDAQSALTGALLDAIERYQGADEVGDAQWALRHARRIAELVEIYDAVETTRDAAAIDLQAALDTMFTSSPAEATQFVRVIFDTWGSLGGWDRVQEGWLNRSQELLPVLLNSNADPAFVAEVVDDHNANRVLSATPPSDNVKWQVLLDEIDAADEAFASAVAGFVDQSDALIPPLEAEVGSTDADPTLEIAIVGTPSAGAVVDLSVASSPGQTVAWDLDADGEFDDGAGAATSWTVPGDAMVGVPLLISAQATGTGVHDVVTTAVIVAPGGNRPPDIADPGTKEYLFPSPGATESLTVAATDPDGDPLTYTWLVNGVDQPGETAASFDFDVPDGALGNYFVEVLVSDGQATTKTAFFLWAVSSDLDGDGYVGGPYGPDCLDDQSAAPPGIFATLVGPHRAETPGNGFDDDCDGTIDEPPPPGSITVLVRKTAANTTPNVVTEGDEVVLDVPWFHFNMASGDDYRFTVDWDDGTTEDFVVSHPNTAVELRHQYGDQGRDLRPIVCWEWLDDPGDPNETNCSGTVFDVLNDRPFVNAADLSTWGPTQFGTPTPDVNAGHDPIDPDGKALISRLNPSYPVVTPSNEPLAPDGYGRATIHHDVVFNVDNDSIGALFGYDPTFDVDPVAANGPEGELLDPDGEVLGVVWGNDTDPLAKWAAACPEAPDNNVFNTRPDPLNAWLLNGIPFSLEGDYLDTFNFPDGGGAPQDPGCYDDAGFEVLDSVDTALDPAIDPGANVWAFRITDAEDLGPGATLDHVRIER